MSDDAQAKRYERSRKLAVDAQRIIAEGERARAGAWCLGILGSALAGPAALAWAGQVARLCAYSDLCDACGNNAADDTVYLILVGP